MDIRPISFKDACAFIDLYHRHHPSPQGCKFCVSLYSKNTIIGVAIAGRPVSRKLDDGFTLEITRVCTLGNKNACSMLYGACCRIGREMGYKKAITYILESENGKSLLASNFICDCEKAGKEHWTGVRDKHQNIPSEMKKRFSKLL